MPELPLPLPGRSTTQDQVAVGLASSCYRLKQILSELTELHVRIDQPERQPGLHADTALRLRKAYHHIRAIIGWPVDTLILHAMGPDIRAAQSHLYPIVISFLHEPGYPDDLAPVRGNFELSRELLDAFSHPSPQVLLRPRHLGGLEPGSVIERMATLFRLLGELALNYCTALDALANELGNGDSTELIEMSQRIHAEIESTPIAYALEAAIGNDAGT